MFDLTKRIVIIGAGAAGLTTAEALKCKGYSNIKILERSARAGGKCYSVEHEARFYELGAGVLSAANRTVLNLAKKYNVPVEKVTFGQSLFIDTATGKAIAKASYWPALQLKLQVLFKYRRLLKQHHLVATPGWSGLKPELAMPFTDWAKQHGLAAVAKELEPFFTGYGYGYFDEIPAAYVLKYYSWEIIKAFAQRRMYKLPGGMQHLWTAISKHNTVFYNTHIKLITRGQHISIRTNRETIECDALIVTGPLDEFAKLTDVSVEEKNLFEKIQYYDYRTYALFLNHFPKTIGYLPGNYRSSRIGHPVFWYQRYQDSNLYTFYSYGGWTMTDKQVLSNITQLVKQLGGTVESVRTIEHWKFFPHIGTTEMRAGYFDRLEKLQGQRNTYYAGELLNFSTVGLTAEYAEALVERYF